MYNAILINKCEMIFSNIIFMLYSNLLKT